MKTRIAKRNKHERFNIIIDLARTKGGACLSSINDYFDSKTKLTFQCAKNHIFDVRANAMIMGGWCRSCFFDSQRASIQEIIDFVHSKGGDAPFIETEYKNNNTPITWQCEF